MNGKEKIPMVIWCYNPNTPEQTINNMVKVFEKQFGRQAIGQTTAYPAKQWEQGIHQKNSSHR